MKHNKKILAISWMSFFWAQASLMVFAVLPVFLAEELNVSYTKIGAIEGLAIGSSFATKVISGFLTDYFRHRKPFIILGSFLSLLSKPLFAISSGLPFVFLARFFDRFSKGIRSAPTDAFIADHSTQETAAKNFCLRQSYCTAGAVVGALCSMAILAYDESWFRVVFWAAALPNLLALGIFFFSLSSSSEKELSSKIMKQNFSFSQLKNLSPFFWKFLFVMAFLMVARFSEAFILLYTRGFSCPRSCLPLIIIVMDIVHSLVAARTGSISNKYSALNLLLIGLVILVANNFWFYYASSLTDVFIGIAVIGVHMGLTQGLIRSIIADNIPTNLRGSSYALFYLVSGLCISFSNYIAGYISDRWGMKYIFVFGAFFSICAFFALALLSYKKESKVSS